MDFVRLKRHAFARRYEGIGYLYDEISYAEMIFDECGAVFLSEIGRKPNAVPAAARRIAARFVDGNPVEVEHDFREWIVDLEQSGFVVTGQTVADLDKNDPAFSYNHALPAQGKADIAGDDFAPSAEVLKEHFGKYPRPFSAQIELTSFCNLKCIHCYLGDSHPAGGLRTEQVQAVLDDLKDLGTLQVSFTGGEIFSRTDLPTILRHARRNDFSITLLTNNTLLSDALLAEFRQTQVRLVKISLYSMDPKVHDGITGKPGSWRRTVGNIERLVAGDVPVQVSCPVMKQNLASFAEVMRWGQKMRFKVKPDLMLTARSDFSRENLGHRLSLDECEEAIRTIIAIDDEYRAQVARESGVRKHRKPDDRLCGVGISTLSIGATGDIYPCPVFPLKLGNIAEVSIRDVWERSSVIHELRETRLAAYPKCLQCESSDYCSICMGKFYSESGGDRFATSNFFCGVPNLNKRLVEDIVAG